MIFLLIWVLGVMNGYDMFLPGKRLHFAKKNMAIEIVDIPIKKMEKFRSYVNVYQRVNH